MASVRQRKTGWSAVWRDPDYRGKQRSRLFKTEADAGKYAQRIDAGTADVSPAKRSAVTLRQYSEIWLAKIRNPESTKRAYRTCINQLPTLADQPMWWIASHPAEVEDAIGKSTRLNHGPLYAAVKRCCDHAVRYEVIDSHKLSGLEVQRDHGTWEFVRTTPEQRQALADALDSCKHKEPCKCPNRGIAIWLLSGLGIRIGECIGLRGTDFRNEFRTARLTQTIDRGNPTGRLKKRQRGKYRDVPVPAWLAEKVEAHVTQNGPGPLFPGTRGKEYASYNAVGSRISEAAREIGLVGFSPHQFRHAYVTDCLDAGVNPAHLSEYTGDGLGVLMDVYRHVRGEAFDADRTIIDSIGM